MNPAGGVDYAKLEEAMKTTLAALKHLTIHPSQIDLDHAAAYVAGGFGDVHSATLKGPKAQRVAVKKLRPAGDMKQRLRVAAALARELKVWSIVKHGNILSLIAFHFDDQALDCAWIVTEWQEYGNVLNYVAMTNPDVNRRLELARDTASGLNYLHTRSPPIVHADIKAENTLVNTTGRALLCDFGMSQLLEEIPSGLTTTTPHTGTVRYASPELLNDDNPHHTLQSDVWAWGCLLLTILTGIPPYQRAKLDYNVILAISRGDMPVDLSRVDIREDVKVILTQSWNRVTDLRPPMHLCLGKIYDSIQEASPTAFQSNANSVQAEEDFISIAIQCQRQSDFDKAMYFERALQHNPESERALAQVAYIARSRRDLAKAIEFFVRALDCRQENGRIWSALGNCYLMQDDLEKAFGAYQQALYHLPNPKLDFHVRFMLKDPKLWYGIGILYNRYGSLDNAEEAFASVLRMDANFEKADDILFRLGIIYKQQQKYTDSLDCFDRILRNPPAPLTRLDIWFQIGHVYEQSKNYEQAREAYERVLIDSPHHAKVLQQLGSLYHQPGTTFVNQPMAIKCLGKALESDNSDARSWYLLGRTYVAVQKYHKAYEAYQQAVHRDGGNPALWCSIGSLYYDVNQYRDAFDAYSRSIRINPSIPEVWFNLGLLYESCKNPISDPIAAYIRAADLDPDNQDVKTRLELLKGVQANGGMLPAAPGPQDVHPTAYTSGHGPPSMVNEPRTPFAHHHQTASMPPQSDKDASQSPSPPNSRTNGERGNVLMGGAARVLPAPRPSTPTGRGFVGNYRHPGPEPNPFPGGDLPPPNLNEPIPATSIGEGILPPLLLNTDLGHTPGSAGSDVLPPSTHSHNPGDWGGDYRHSLPENSPHVDGSPATNPTSSSNSGSFTFQLNSHNSSNHPAPEPPAQGVLPSSVSPSQDYRLPSTSPRRYGPPSTTNTPLKRTAPEPDSAATATQKRSRR